jgi:AraC family transcriptional regulator of adaptative response/methylated-DNA-[protein]-cysteine methyltransferase
MQKEASKIVEYGFVKTPFGDALVAARKTGVCFIGFPKNKQEGMDELSKRFSGETLKKRTNFDWKKMGRAKFDLHGTPFQMKVWEALRNIKPGRLSTYGTIAKQIKHPKAVRAVGTAVGKNPIAYFIPCHRVIQSSGKMGSYHWGPKIKEAMIDAEASG